MSNNLNMDLTGMTVVVRPGVLKPEHDTAAQRVFVVQGGFGAQAETSGTKCMGFWVLDREQDVVRGYEIERLATWEDIQVAEKLRAPY